MEALFIHMANKLESIRLGKGGSDGGGVSKTLGLSELKTVDLWRAVLAEFMAQILFVFLGVSSTTYIGTTADPGRDVASIYFVKIALAFGLAIMALIQMIGHVSGGHINPAVTIAMAVTLNISLIRAVLYVVAQCIGAIIGAFIVKGLTPDKFPDGIYGVTGLGSGVTQGQGFGVELLLTFVLVMVIYGTTDPHRPAFGSPAILIGLTVTLGHLAGIEYTGASMNPSRSLGSAVASDSWDDHWIYWVGPIAGGVLAGVLYKFVLNPYRGAISMDEALDKLQGDENFVVVPREYFKKGDKQTNSTTSHM